MSFTTADLCDQYESLVQVVTTLFHDYGGVRLFSGRIVTLEVFEDNLLVRETLENRAVGRVLVVDGNGSTRCALVGDNLAALAYKNGWAGIIVYGCVRDSVRLAQVPIGIKAIGTNPMPSFKTGAGARNRDITFGGTVFMPGSYIYADEDGVIVSDRRLL
jgi:regulator of ribonuclease activity A